MTDVVYPWPVKECAGCGRPIRADLANAECQRCASTHAPDSED